MPTLSSVGASIAPPCFRLHTPLIEPGVRIARTRLSEKAHDCHPRKTAGPVEYGVRDLPGRPPRDTVLSTQPLASMAFHGSIGLVDWSETEVVA